MTQRVFSAFPRSPWEREQSMYGPGPSFVIAFVLEMLPNKILKTDFHFKNQQDTIKTNNLKTL